MGRTRPPYPPEFRAEAVRLVRDGGQPIPEVARDLGCSEQTLRNWVAQAAIDAGEAEGLTSDERAELGRLRRENGCCVRSGRSCERQRPSSLRRR